MTGVRLILLIVAGLALLVGYSAVYSVDETQQALVVRLGEVKDVQTTPGLKFKAPLIDNIVYLDKRILPHDTATSEVTLSDQRRLVVDAFARFRIADPNKFFTSVNNEANGRDRLERLIESKLKEVLGRSSFTQVLSAERIELMREIKDQVNKEASDPQKGIGIELVDLRIKRTDLPAENSEAIFQRMRSEREKEAREARAQGFEEAQRIKARADRERTVLLAEARREAEGLRGQGDGQALKVINDAARQDPEFYNFYLAMQAYRDTLGGGNTSMVLTPNSDFFKYFRDSRGDLKGR